MEFKGKTAVVTGGASGIGYGLAEAFAGAGMKVVLADIEAPALEKAAQQLRDGGAEAIGVVTDVSKEASVHALAERSIAEYGKVHILCNNAGVTSSSSALKAAWEISNSDWDWVMGVNFYGVLYGLQAFMPHMVAHGEDGHVVNTASGAAMLPGQGPYGASKHAILNLTETLYFDLQARELPIGASVLCPGIVQSRIVEAERNRPGGVAEPLAPELIEAGMAMLAAGKKPSEVAAEVLKSIQAKSLYILPNPAWDEFFLARVEHILARGGPLIVDNLGILERNAAGEDF